MPPEGVTRVFTAAISAETNVFSPVPTDMASFTDHLYAPAGTLDPDGAAAWPAPLEAFRQGARRRGWTLSQGLCASATPGGPVPQAVYEQLRDRLLDDLRAAAPVEVVALCLHGAMIATGCEDCEGDVLARVRAIVGPDAIVGAVLDPHAHLTGAMIAAADLLVFFKEYPHTDVFDSAATLFDRLADLRAGAERSRASVCDCRMISFYFTDREPMAGLVRAMRAAEREPGVVSVSLVHGFPWGDTPDMGSKVLVYARDAARGAAVAREIGQRLFALRGRTLPDLISAEAAVALVRDAAGGPVVLADAADNPGGGAPGDSTFLVAALAEAGVGPVVVGPFWDPLLVRQAFALGPGARARLRLGGKGSPYSGAPLDVEAEVVRLAPQAHQIAEDWAWPMGDAALVRFGAIDVVATSERLQAINESVFAAVGADVRRYRAVVVKSAQHFQAAFAGLASEIAYVDTPGALVLGADPGRYRRLSRPKWPFDADPFSADAAPEGVSLKND